MSEELPEFIKKLKQIENKREQIIKETALKLWGIIESMIILENYKIYNFNNFLIFYENQESYYYEMYKKLETFELIEKDEDYHDYKFIEIDKYINNNILLNYNYSIAIKCNKYFNYGNVKKFAFKFKLNKINLFKRMLKNIKIKLILVKNKEN